MTQNYLKPI